VITSGKPKNKTIALLRLPAYKQKTGIVKLKALSNHQIHNNCSDSHPEKTALFWCFWFYLFVNNRI
jgi:hypothetical protein